GEGRVLDEGLSALRREVSALELDRRATDTDRAERLDELAALLDAAYHATRRTDLLEEAIAAERRAVTFLEPSGALADPPDELRPLLTSCLSRLGVLLIRSFENTVDNETFKEAGMLANRAMQLAGAELSPELSANAAVVTRRMAETVKDLELFEVAVTLQRIAVEETPADHVTRPARIAVLVQLLVELWDEQQEDALLDEAWAAIENAQPKSPFDQVDLARMRARIMQAHPRKPHSPADIVDVLSPALETAQRFGAAEPDITRRRNIAQRFDGLLGELVVKLVQAGDLDQAIRRIEDERIWLPAPPDGAVAVAGTTETRTIPVAWVASGWDVTAVITTVDHATYTSHLIEVPRTSIQQWVLFNTILQSYLSGQGKASPQAERERTVTSVFKLIDLQCSIATKVAATFPRVEELLVVPVGICELLPFTAAQRGDRHLIDETALTIAPSLAWARAARRPRPDGPSFGAFHPGTANDLARHVETGKEQFAGLVGGTVLDRAADHEVLARFDGAAVAHFCCHGRFDERDPFESYLELDPPLSVRDVLQQPSAPWLVNLAACSTAIHDLHASEQHISLATAFLLPGASHVLANLWASSAQAGTIFDRAFYGHLADGLRPALAHQRAVRQVRDELTALHGESHPFLWAPFTHFGSPW
ncbi:MAG TPA: CHAT domain-containing protein, partial [Acidimicrobiales bacterium]